MSKILVTGGCGLIGRNAVAALVRLGEQVCVLDSLAYGSDAPFPDGVDFVKGSTGDVETLTTALTGMDRCLHLAGSPVLTAPRESRANVDDALKLAADRFFQVAGKCGVPVVYASSAAVYGNCVNSAIEETAPVDPVNAHGMEKAALENAAAECAEKYEVSSIGLRMFNIYGSGQSPKSPYCGVVRLFAEKILRGMPITIRGNGAQQRDFVYVDDAVRAATAALAWVGEDSAEVVNICTGRPVTLLDVIASLHAATEVPIDVVYDNQADPGVACSVGSPAKAKALLDFTAEVSLEDGTARMIRELEAATG